MRRGLLGLSIPVFSAQLRHGQARVARRLSHEDADVGSRWPVVSRRSTARRASASEAWAGQSVGMAWFFAGAFPFQSRTSTERCAGAGRKRAGPRAQLTGSPLR
jgi:hypothetical protein